MFLTHAHVYAPFLHTPLNPLRQPGPISTHTYIPMSTSGYMCLHIYKHPTPLPSSRTHTRPTCICPTYTFSHAYICARTYTPTHTPPYIHIPLLYSRHTPYIYLHLYHTHIIDTYTPHPVTPVCPFSYTHIPSPYKQTQRLLYHSLSTHTIHLHISPTPSSHTSPYARTHP